MDDESTKVSIQHLVRLVLHESKKNLSAGWDKLAENLSRPELRGPQFSSESLRKYASGVENISRSRALDIFNLVSKAGLAGPIAVKAIEQLSNATPKGLGIFPPDEIESLSAELAKQRYADSRLEKAAVANLRKALNQLSDFVWNRHELEYIALSVIQEISRYEGSADSCGGGLLTPHSLPVFRKQDCGYEHVILSWSVSSHLDTSTPD